MKDNRGVTLVELLVVMLIIGILSGGAMFGVKCLNTSSAKNTSEHISAMLNAVRIENMSKDKTYYLVIEESNGNYYYSVEAGDVINREIISKKKLELRDGEITYRNSGDTTEYLVTSTVKMEVCFRKDTGGILANSEGKIISSIGVSASNRAYSIGLVETTGKHYIE